MSYLDYFRELTQIPRPSHHEPHSTSERIDLNTADDIWRVTLELLRRLD